MAKTTENATSAPTAVQVELVADIEIKSGPVAYTLDQTKAGCVVEVWPSQADWLVAQGHKRVTA